MTDQPTGARYPAVVALLRQKRASAAEDADCYDERVRCAGGQLAVIRSRAVPRAEDAARISWWEANAAHYRDLIEQRESLVRQIDAALAVLAGEDGE